MMRRSAATFIFLVGCLAFAPEPADAAGYPSGFEDEDCWALLADDAKIPDLGAFKKLSLKNKVRGAHAMAGVVGAILADAAEHLARAVLATESFGTLPARLRIVGETPLSRLKPYADELRAISHHLVGVVAVVEELDVGQLADVRAFTKVAAELPYDAADDDQENLRSVAYVNLAVVEAELIGRSSDPSGAAIRSLHALIASARGPLSDDQVEHVRAGLPMVLTAVTAGPEQFTGAEQVIIDELARDILSAPSLSRVPGSADLTDSLARLRADLSADEFPQLAQALDDVINSSAKEIRARSLN